MAGWFSALFPPAVWRYHRKVGRRTTRNADPGAGGGQFEAVRHTLFRWMFSLYMLLGLPAIAIGILDSIRADRWPFAVAYGVLYFLAMLVLAFSRRLPFHAAAGSFLAADFALSVTVLARLGIAGAGVPLLIAFCVLCTVFLGIRWGIAAIAVSMSVFVFIGAGMVLGFLPVPDSTAMNSSSALSWINFGFLFLLLTVAMVKAPQILRDNLAKALSAAESDALRLEESNRSLQEENRIRREAEEALQRSEERYRQIVDHAAEAIFVAQDGFIRFPNPRLAEMLGYGEGELRSLPLLHFVHPDDRGLITANHEKRIRGEAVPESYSFRAVRKDGGERWAELNAVRILWDGRPATLNFARDITEQKRLEAQYRHAQKMEAVGTLAGGIAHDFNNLLQIIHGYAEMLCQETDPQAPGYGNLEEIRKAAARGGVLTRQLLTFSQKVESAKRPVDLNRELERLRGLLGRVLPKRIEIELRPGPDVPPVEADPGQMEQVLMNLAINARDAMPEGGRLTIGTERADPDGEFLSLHPDAKPGSCVRVRIRDTGLGMSESVRRRIFEPFFTTKETGRGTGLGLAMAYGIVRSHGGVISCRSAPGAGTTFTILLPAASGQPEAEEGPVPVRAAGGSETILLVDDEESLRHLGARMLGKAGYTVRTASSGEEALEAYRDGGGPIDLVILDLMMPGMGGALCLRELLALDPAARVLVASGTGGDGLPPADGIAGAKGSVNKPYQAALLLRAIRDVLDGGDGFSAMAR